MANFTDVLAAYQKARVDSIQTEAEHFQSFLQRVEPMRKIVKELMSSLEWPEDMWTYVPADGENVPVGSEPPLAMIEIGEDGHLACVVRLFLDTRGAHFDVKIERTVDGDNVRYEYIRCLTNEGFRMSNDGSLREWAVKYADRIKDAVAARFSAAD